MRVCPDGFLSITVTEDKVYTGQDETEANSPGCLFC